VENIAVFGERSKNLQGGNSETKIEKLYSFAELNLTSFSQLISPASLQKSFANSAVNLLTIIEFNEKFLE
jgi:hypothetical protein